MNAGPKINTPEDDKSPFIHPDGRTLYFSSSGHPGMGGSDLFLLKKMRMANGKHP
ncbi:MAG: PD40 domain-containing protein [Bacteroidetes bacterium]|nr:PD40 domain-containing protein [Bacteroidota bacterium]